MDSRSKMFASKALEHAMNGIALVEQAAVVVEHSQVYKPALAMVLKTPARAIIKSAGHTAAAARIAYNNGTTPAIREQLVHAVINGASAFVPYSKIAVGPIAHVVNREFAKRGF